MVSGQLLLNNCPMVPAEDMETRQQHLHEARLLVQELPQLMCKLYEGRFPSSMFVGEDSF